ncbi:MAG: hypothetical protein C4315_08445 [Chloroflexota bacterium]
MSVNPIELVFRLLVILALVALNGFFVAAEFGLVAVRRSRVEQLEAEGHPLAPAVRHALDHLNAYLAVAQLGITMASLALGWVGEPLLAELLEPIFGFLSPALQVVSAHAVATAVAFGLITTLHIILGEQAPKILAIQRSEAVSLAVSVPMRVFFVALRPFVGLLNGASSLTLRALGLRPVAGEQLVHSVEELRLLVVASRQAGVLEPTEEEIVERALVIGEKTVYEVMVPRTLMVAVPEDATICDAVKLCLTSGHRRLPVYRGTIDNIVGVVHLRDMVAAVWPDCEPQACHRPVRELMREPLFVPENATIDSVLAQMRRGDKLAIVVEERGGTAGLVTLTDLVTAILGELTPEAHVKVQPDGSLIIDGLTSIEEVNEHLGTNLDDPEYDTIGGFVTGRLGRIPRVGDTIEVDGYRFSVESMVGLRVGTLRVERLGRPGILVDKAGE